MAEVEAQPTERQEFILRGFLALSKRINEGPTLVEDDWRTPFIDTFEMSAGQRNIIDSLRDEHVERVQQAFRLAAQCVRSGEPVKPRVVSDLAAGNRRELRRKLPQPLCVRRTSLAMK